MTFDEAHAIIHRATTPTLTTKLVGGRVEYEYDEPDQDEIAEAVKIVKAAALKGIR